MSTSSMVKHLSWISIGYLSLVAVAFLAGPAAGKINLIDNAQLKTPGTAMPSGSIIDYAGSSAPSGWVICNGASYDGTQTTYSGLYSAIGLTYGGTGSTAFKVPDFRGRVALCAGTGSGLTTRSMGSSGGEESHVLTISEMPQHNHVMSNNGDPLAPGNQGSGIAQTSYGTLSGYQYTGLTGSSAGHNTMPPYLVVVKLIKL
jgi:microcystin-dependent protein